MNREEFLNELKENVIGLSILFLVSIEFVFFVNLFKC